MMMTCIPDFADSKDALNARGQDRYGGITRDETKRSLSGQSRRRLLPRPRQRPRPALAGSAPQLAERHCHPHGYVTTGG